MLFRSLWCAIAPAVVAILSLVLAACGGVIPTAVSTPAMADSGEAPRRPPHRPRRNPKSCPGSRGWAHELAEACGSGDGESLDSLQLVGVDIELNSIILTNGGGNDLLANDVWVYQNRDAYELGIFTIEPRATILFNVRVNSAESIGRAGRSV